MEYSLIGYTVFMQLAGGLALVAWLGGFSSNTQIERKLWLVAFLAGLIGCIASTFHLTDILHSPYTITQLGHAWMSREILCTGIFMLLVLLRVLRIIPAGLNAIIGIMGVILCLAMAQVYALNPAIPLWNTTGTNIHFITTLLILGGFAGLALSNAANNEGDASVCPVSCMARVSGAAIIIGLPFLLVMPLYWTSIIPVTTLDPAAFDRFNSYMPCLGLIQAGGTAIAGLLAALGWRKNSALLWLAVIIVTASALAGRTLFFLADAKVGF